MKLDYDLQLSNQILTLQTSEAKLEHAIVTSDTANALKITADAMKSALENLHGVPQLMTQMEGQRQKLEHVVESLYLDDSLEEELNRLMEEMTEPPQAQAQAETMDLKVENTETKTQAPSDTEHIVEDLDDSNLEEETLTVEMAEPPEVSIFNPLSLLSLVVTGSELFHSLSLTSRSDRDLLFRLASIGVSILLRHHPIEIFSSVWLRLAFLSFCAIVFRLMTHEHDVFCLLELEALVFHLHVLFTIGGIANRRFIQEWLPRFALFKEALLIIMFYCSLLVKGFSLWETFGLSSFVSETLMSAADFVSHP
ncbi:hypothetical protein DY000_02058186 [Brassica cretica]|uniref:Transmembrane protein n=1 Tax=Brassica cretica TaxID=69181 RepID=A0ABQ7A7I8_BRACR|nr:hypothetical protein DY000_02058186 [Brassica cretica]